MPPIDIGKDTNDPNNFNSVWGVPQLFEIWFNDGKDWYTFKTGDDTPYKATTLVNYANADPFSAIRKFDTLLKDDYNSVANITNFKKFWASEVRIVYKSFFGNVLASKLGITVEDENNAICPNKCTAKDTKQCGKPSYW